MFRAPAFWFRGGGLQGGWLGVLLSPISAIVTAVTARRVAHEGWRSPMPVICCGNVTVGGAGKTTLVLDLAKRLMGRGLSVHLLLRGYGGSARGPRRVRATDTAAEVGDEALLLAGVAPTWIGADRAASARAAVADGAAVLLMDDGLQNPTLRKDFSLLVIDGATGFGNGRVLPAGPLREPVAAGAARCHAAVLIGEDRTGAISLLPPALPVLRVELVQGSEIDALRGRRVLAFAGIARPDKFFDPLVDAGLAVVMRLPFPDHHLYSRRELETVLEQADHLDSVPVTTPKDAVRLPPDILKKVHVVGVGLKWQNEDALDRLIRQFVDRV